MSWRGYFVQLKSVYNLCGTWFCGCSLLKIRHQKPHENTSEKTPPHNKTREKTLVNRQKHQKKNSSTQKQQREIHHHTKTPAKRKKHHQTPPGQRQDSQKVTFYHIVREAQHACCSRRLCCKRPCCRRLFSAVTVQVGPCKSGCATWAALNELC